MYLLYVFFYWIKYDYNVWGMRKTKMKDERKKYWRFSQTQIEGIVFAGYF